MNSVKFSPYRITRMLVVFGFTAFFVACGERKTKSAESTSSSEEIMTISGVLSLDTELSDHLISLFRVKEGKEIESLLEPVNTLPDGSYSFEVPLNGALAILQNEVLITMSKHTEGSKAVMLWSYLKASSAEETSNLNVLASIAYEIGVLKNDLKAVYDASELTADAFGLTGEARAIERLDPKNGMLTRLGKIVSLIASESSAKVSEVHIAIASDLLDGVLDGKNQDAPISLVTEDLYTATLNELKSVIAGNEPDLDSVKQKIPTE